jgi:hypothetical protein
MPEIQLSQVPSSDFQYYAATLGAGVTPVVKLNINRNSYWRRIWVMIANTGGANWGINSTLQFKLGSLLALEIPCINDTTVLAQNQVKQFMPGSDFSATYAVQTPNAFRYQPLQGGADQTPCFEVVCAADTLELNVIKFVGGGNPTGVLIACLSRNYP